MESFTQKVLDDMELAISKSVIFRSLDQDMFVHTLSFLNAVNVLYLESVCKKFYYLIQKNYDRWPVLNLSAYEGKVKNIKILRLFSKCTGLKRVVMNSKVSTPELQRFLDFVKDTLEEFSIENSALDFPKLFRDFYLPRLRLLRFTNTEKLIEDIDIKLLINGC